MNANNFELAREGGKRVFPWVCASIYAKNRTGFLEGRVGTGVGRKSKRHGFRAMPLILSAVLTDEHASLTSRVASPPKNIGKRGKVRIFWPCLWNCLSHNELQANREP